MGTGTDNYLLKQTGMSVGTGSLIHTLSHARTIYSYIFLLLLYNMYAYQFY